MSASREKKQRQTDIGGGANGKQRQAASAAQSAKNKTILYSVLAVVTAVAVVLLLLWNHGFFTKNKVVATLGNQSFTVTELGYYYYPQAGMYAMYGITLDDAMKENLRAQALNSMQQHATLAAAAQDAQFTLSEEGKQEIADTMKSIEEYAAQSGISTDAYIRNVYGSNMNKGLMEKCLTREMLAAEYYNSQLDSLSYDESAIADYYAEHAADLDTFVYSAAFLNGKAPDSIDADGNDVAATEAEMASAMAVAKANADSLIAELTDGGDFSDLGDDYAARDDASTYTDKNALLGNALTNALNSDCKDWLTDSSRVAGDFTMIEVENQGYFVVQFLDRYLDESTYATADVRHILIKAEVAEGETEPTQEAIDAAKAEVDALLAQWQAGDKTAESFAALAEEHSDDPGSNTNGGLYEGVASGSFFPAFNSWMFDPARQLGDTTVVENPQEGQQGWHVIYFVQHGELQWRATILNTLKGEAMETWMTGLEEATPFTTNEENLPLL